MSPLWGFRFIKCRHAIHLSHLRCFDLAIVDCAAGEMVGGKKRNRRFDDRRSHPTNSFDLFVRLIAGRRFQRLVGSLSQCAPYKLSHAQGFDLAIVDCAAGEMVGGKKRNRRFDERRSHPTKLRFPPRRDSERDLYRLRYTSPCQKLRFSSFQVCSADCRDSPLWLSVQYYRHFSWDSPCAVPYRPTK